VRLRWRAFLLHPDIPPQGLALARMLAGMPVDIKAIAAKYAALAAELGLPFVARDMVYNSRPAHEIGYWAAARQKAEAWHTAVFQAYYARGRNISAPEELADMAVSIGLPRDAAIEVLAKGNYAGQVDQDLALAAQANIIAAPTFIIGDARLVGAQPYEKLQRFVEANGAVKR
jgi:predicted DsbA family dithiol-disulfide isomerase